MNPLVVAATTVVRVVLTESAFLNAQWAASVWLQNSSIRSNWKIFQWKKLPWRKLNQIQENWWAYRNLIDTSRVNSLFKKHAGMKRGMNRILRAIRLTWLESIVIIKEHSRGTKGMQTRCLRAANTVLSFLNPAVITCDGLDAICWSWSLLNLLPIPKEKSSIPLRFKLLAGWTTLSCETPSVRITRTGFLPLILPREKRNLGTTKYIHTVEYRFFKPFTVFFSNHPMSRTFPKVVRKIGIPL